MVKNDPKCRVDNKWKNRSFQNMDKIITITIIVKINRFIEKRFRFER